MARTTIEPDPREPALMKMPRWRLRTLQIAVAGLAVLLAVYVSLRSRALARQEAIEAVERLGGTYGIRITGPDWYRRLMGRAGVDERAFYDPLRVSLGPGNQGYDPAHPIRDEDLAALAPHLALFPNLELLDLRSCREITDRGLARLPELPGLKQVRLQGTGVTAAGVEQFRRRHPGLEVSQ